MGIYLPIYPPQEWAKLDKEKRKALSAAILQVLTTDQEVRQLLRQKTQTVLDGLKKPG
jgi:hypothetical protein